MLKPFKPFLDVKPIPNAYEALKGLTRTNSVINAESIAAFIETLEVSESVKQEMRVITPSNYTGI